MRLYVNPISPFCRAAAIYIAEKDVPLETVELTTGADRALLLEINPQGEVPVLDTGRGVVVGSQSIADFADLEYPEPRLVLSDPSARVAHRQLEDVACSTTDALQFLVHLVSSRRPDLVESVPDLPAQLDEAVQEHYGFLDTTLGQAPFEAGSFHRADIFLFSMVSSLVFMGRSIRSPFASLTSWFGRIAARQSVARNLEHAARSAATQAASPDPFFGRERIHWRSHRVEWACRLGLARWLATEIEHGRVFFSPPPRSQCHPGGSRCS